MPRTRLIDLDMMNEVGSEKNIRNIGGVVMYIDSWKELYDHGLLDAKESLCDAWRSQEVFERNTFEEK
jgi:hypothetical protein